MRHPKGRTQATLCEGTFQAGPFALAIEDFIIPIRVEFKTFGSPSFILGAFHLGSQSAGAAGNGWRSRPSLA